MSLIPMNTEQLRRQAIKNAEDRREQERQYQAKVEQMSKHNVGGFLDIREIKKSQAFKEQKEYFDIKKVESEYEDMMTYNHLIDKRQKYLDMMKSLGQSPTDAHSLRQWSKTIDEIVGDVLIAFDVKRK